MKPALIAIAAVLTLAVSAVPAFAEVYPEGTGEPAYTNSAQNTQWFRWQAPAGTDDYKVRYDYYRNNAAVTSMTTQGALTGTSWSNWSGVAALEHGGQYGICAQGSYSFPSDSLFFPDGPNSCSMGTMLGKRTYTTIDRSKPTVNVSAAGGATYTKTSQVPFHIDFTDDVAGPYPGNFVCAEAGAGSTCSGIYGYSPECSVPNTAGKVNSFDCSIELSGSAIPDGPVRLCAIAADAAIPDNPNGPDQSGSADKANLSAAQCDTITLDRAEPSVAINASATSVTTGQPVTFSASASDSGSGLASRQWAWSDGTPGSSSDSAVHAFGSPGTYVVELKVTDAAANEGVATKAITVTASPSNGGGGNGGGGSNGGNNGGSSGGSGSTGGGAQGAKALSVLAPKKVKVGRRSILIAVNTAKAGKLSIGLAKGKRTFARTSAILAGGSKGVKLRLPKGLKAGKHTLKVSFKPVGATKAVTMKLSIKLTGGKKAKKASIARTTSARPRIAHSSVPAPKLPDGRHP